MKKLADGGVMCPVPDPHKYRGEEYNAAFLSYIDRAINELPDQNQPVMFTPVAGRLPSTGLGRQSVRRRYVGAAARDPAVAQQLHPLAERRT